MATNTDIKETTPSSSKSSNGINNIVLWVTYINIVLYAMSYQLQSPVEPFLIKKLSEEAGDADGVNETYGNLQSFFNSVQMIGSPLVGVLLDRIGIRYTSAIVFLSSATCYAILSVAYDLRTLFLSKIPAIFQAAFLVAQATAATSCGNNSAARAAALGRMTTAYTIGATLGPSIGGYLADKGDFYIGARLAIFLSLVSVTLSLVYLPNEVHLEKTDKEKEPLKGNPKSKKGRTFWEESARSIGIALRPTLWPLLAVKILGGVVASIHSTAMPLILTQELQLEPSQFGMSMSANMISVAAFGAIGMAPLTKALGPPGMTYVGLTLRAAMGCAVAFIVSVAWGDTQHVLLQIVCVGILHALASHTLATGLTTQTTGAVAPDEQGSLLGLEHSFFSLARIAGPKIATMLLSFGNGLWPVEISCGLFDVILALGLFATASQLKQKSP